MILVQDFYLIKIDFFLIKIPLPFNDHPGDDFKLLIIKNNYFYNLLINILFLN